MKNNQLNDVAIESNHEIESADGGINEGERNWKIMSGGLNRDEWLKVIENPKNTLTNPRTPLSPIPDESDCEYCFDHHTSVS